MRNLEEGGEKEGWKEITRDLKHDQFSATYIFFSFSNFLLFSRSSTAPRALFEENAVISYTRIMVPSDSSFSPRQSANVG